ncbi:MAG: outer membrane protein assembly factor BamD [Blastocatellia bacterium]|nr:outer membrane protein assembly factor BamD [Blastocatellia bacterium]
MQWLGLLEMTLCLGWLPMFSVAGEGKPAGVQALHFRQDQKLFEKAVAQLSHHQYEKARHTLQHLLKKSPDGQFTPFAKLLVADSFLHKGGDSNCTQAEATYNEWLHLFPQHPLAERVMFQIADLRIKQGRPFSDMGGAYLLKVYGEVKALFKKYPELPKNPQLQKKFIQVQEGLASHELNIMRFYFKNRKAWNGVIQRGLPIVKKYPDFSRLDETLFLLGMAYLEKEDITEAGKYLNRLVREFPDGEFRDKAAEQLEKIGLPVPPAAPQREGRLAQRQARQNYAKEDLSWFKISSGEGVLLTKDDRLKPLANLSVFDKP